MSNDKITGWQDVAYELPSDETPAESREREPYECKRYETLEDWRKSREEP